MTQHISSKQNSHLLIGLIGKILSSRTKKTSSQAGFSLVESLVAVVVVSVLLTGMAPFLALTFGQRVQARRVDQATQAARAYIDGVRSGAITVPNQFPNGDFTLPNLGVAALTALPTDPGTQISTDDNPFSTSNPQHLVIQAIRSPCQPVPTGCTNNTDLTAVRLQGFRLSVRVYRADAFSTATTLVTAFDASGNSRIQSSFSGTLGSKSRPLVVMQSDISQNSTVGGVTGTSYSDYINRYGN